MLQISKERNWKRYLERGSHQYFSQQLKVIKIPTWMSMEYISYFKRHTIRVKYSVSQIYRPPCHISNLPNLIFAFIWATNSPDQKTECQQTQIAQIVFKLSQASILWDQILISFGFFSFPLNVSPGNGSEILFFLLPITYLFNRLVSSSAFYKLFYKK